MGSQKPWVMEKPQRGREMVTKDVAGQEKGRTVRMHEGYVGSQKYMVPDEDLQVMKELVDYRLGKQPEDRYVRDYEYAPAKEADEKLRKMSHRLQKLSSSRDDENADKEEEERRRKELRKIRFEDTISADSGSTRRTTDSKPGSKKRGDDESNETSDTTTSDDSETTTTTATTIRTQDSRYSGKKPEDKYEKPVSESRSKTSSSSDTDEASPYGPHDSSGTAKTLPFEVQPSNVDSIRFLLSGHIRNAKTPIFIFHQFNGRSPFGKQADFYSTEKEGDMDLNISGRFYESNILEEVNNKLKSLNIKPDKIMIDDRCKVFEESFYEVLHVGKVDVDFQGEILKKLGNKDCTPLLKFNVEKTSGSKRSSRSYEISRNPQAVVYITKPESRNIFEQNQEENEIVLVNNEHKHRRSARKEMSWTSNPEDEINSYEPHLKKNHSRNPVERQPFRRDRNQHRDAGDVGSDGALGYHCIVHRRRSSGGKTIFQRLSQMFFSRN